MSRVGVLIALSLLSGSALAQETPAAGEAGQAENSETIEASAAPEASTTTATTAAVEPGKEGTIKDRSIHESRPIGISAMAYIPWYMGVGIGVNARVEIPIVKDGFIPSINDQISLEPSISVGYRSRGYAFVDDRVKYLDITPAIYAMWSFHITPKFRPYGAIGLGYDIGIWLNEDDFGGVNDGIDNGFFYWDVAAGLFYNFSDHVAMRAELGAMGPKIGISGFF
ncbi:MAG: hypothetical protein QM778_18270 [Myxococcales bacterium]